jgi:hypothetical protein
LGSVLSSSSGGKEEGGGVRSRPGLARTILLCHIISASPSTFLHILFLKGLVRVLPGSRFYSCSLQPACLSQERGRIRSLGRTRAAIHADQRCYINVKTQATRILDVLVMRLATHMLLMMSCVVTSTTANDVGRGRGANSLSKSMRAPRSVSHAPCCRRGAREGPIHAFVEWK